MPLASGSTYGRLMWLWTELSPTLSRRHGSLQTSRMYRGKRHRLGSSVNYASDQIARPKAIEWSYTGRYRTTLATGVASVFNSSAKPAESRAAES